MCSREFCAAPCGGAGNESDCTASFDYDKVDAGAPVPLQASLISLPERGGSFDFSGYLGPQLEPWATGDSSARRDPLVASLLAEQTRSCQMVKPGEYPKIVARLYRANMAKLTPHATERPLGMFGVWKIIGEIMRLIVDCRPGNTGFWKPSYENTSGEDLARMLVEEGYDLEAAKLDLRDFFHTCGCPAALHREFGLEPVSAANLRAEGVDVAEEDIDDDGFCHPQLTTLPMGWIASPALAQGAHENVLYGSRGDGSEKARALSAVVDPSARWSSQRVPQLGTDAARAPHALIVDDLLLFRQVPQATMGAVDQRAACGAVRSSRAASAPGVEVDAVRGRYREVGLQDKPSKVADYAREQTIVGYDLKQNELRPSLKKYHELVASVARLRRRGWAQRREVESIVGKITNMFLLHRPALAAFSSVYAFGRKVGHRAARVWPSVLRELDRALALLPLVRSDLGRPVAPFLLHTDASDSGAAAVYTHHVALAELQRECVQPRSLPQELRSLPRDEEDAWTVSKALGAGFEPPLDPQAWRVAFRQPQSPDDHINTKEAATVVNAVRWVARGKHGRRGCRVVVQTDSAVAACAFRKGRSSRPALARQCRRLAAVTLAFRIALVIRWVSTKKNMADRPSRGYAVPGPCDGSFDARAQHDWKRGKRFGEADRPGPPAMFWSPLLDANIGAETRGLYRAALLDFVDFADAWDGGEAIESFADLDYWLAFYAHQAYVTGHPKKYKVTRAVCATEHWMPEAKPLRLVRRCLRGWDRLVPSKPAAPMPRDLARATATMAALLAKTASALAMLVAHDTWLRIGECAGLRVPDVVDSREHADPVMRGVSVFLPEAKTGRRQAVRVEDAEVAVLLVAWRDAVEASEGPDAKLFPPAARLRSDLAEALAPFHVEARGMHFTFHSFRHGGASARNLQVRAWRTSCCAGGGR